MLPIRTHGHELIKNVTATAITFRSIIVKSCPFYTELDCFDEVVEVLILTAQISCREDKAVCAEPNPKCTKSETYFNKGSGDVERLLLCFLTAEHISLG